ncbi:hypothetical protein D3C87_1188010 [compost metagenome]|uniref:hypothetical protein n=1 Tax=Pseudomonas fluorescens TaxID=294 RepID=UPI000F9C6CC9|nr:hypothetical protein [Pseudomonas fluorescens]VVP90410.1 hypothetical protein PS934_01542 [Pseudomonas fluorescens]
MSNRPLLLLVFIHDDLEDYDKSTLYDDHFSWLIDEMESISGRPMAVILISPEDSKGMSNFTYKNQNHGQSLAQWHDRVNEHLDTYPINNFDIKLHKVLLLTRDPINSSVLGVAYYKGYGAIASIAHNRTPAHEVGHLFGANHEDGEVLYDGWWHETTMRPFDEYSNLRGDANRFSDANRESIREYLSEYY